MPSYVTKKGTDGRRYFDKKFIAGVCADIRSGNLTAKQAQAKFKLSEGLVYMWLKKSQPARSGAKPASVTPRPELPPSDLLAKAMSVQRGKTAPADARLKNELKLVIAYAKGQVNREQVKFALDRDGRWDLVAWAGDTLLKAVKTELLVEPR